MCRTMLLVLLGSAIVSASACVAGPQGPTADDGAAHLGLEIGSSHTYASSTGATETHDLVASDVQLFGALTVGLVAKENGFAKESRSLTLGVDVEQATLLRFFSCLNECATLDQPINFIGWPLEEGARVEGEATVTESRDGAVVDVRVERHATTVGPLEDVTVPAGTFSAFLVSWSRTVVDQQGGESSQTALLRWAPDVGIVRHETFDGVTLELAAP